MQTQETQVLEAQDTTTEEKEKEKKKFSFTKPNITKKQGILIGVCAGIAVLMIIAAIIISATRPGYATVYINAEGYDSETSTPVELTIWEGDCTELINDADKKNDPESKTKVIMDANCDWELTDLEAGLYTAQVTAGPILKDGTIYKASEAVSFDYDGHTYHLEFNLEKLDLSKASADEVKQATQAAKQAAEKSGDETKATAVTTNATAAIAASPAATSAGVSAPAVSSSGSSDNGSSNSGSSSASSTPASSNSGSSNSGSSNSGSSASTPASSSSSSNSGSSSSSSSSSGSSSSSASSTPAPQPVHTHNWVAQYTTEQTPIYEEKSVLVCNVCGAQGIDREHTKAHALAGEGSGTHREYPQVLVGYDTQQVLTGYVCSGCGATKQLLKGYALDTAPPYSVSVTTGKTTRVNGTKVYDKPQNDPVDIVLGKYDGEKTYSGTKNLPQGSATLKGAQFTISYYDGQYSTAADAKASGKATRTWVYATDEDGFINVGTDTPISGDALYKDSHGEITFPLGTYLIQETKAPDGYTLNNEVFVRNVTSGGVTTETVSTYNTPTVPDTVKRGDIEFNKIVGSTNKREYDGLGIYMSQAVTTVITVIKEREKK